MYFFTLRSESLLVAHLRVLVEKVLTATALANRGWAWNALNELVCASIEAILNDWSIGVESVAIGVAISLHDAVRGCAYKMVLFRGWHLLTAVRRIASPLNIMAIIIL